MMSLIEELRQMCRSRIIDDFWKRCGELSEIWTAEGARPATDQAIYAGITELDTIVNEHKDSSCYLLNLAVMMIRITLEKSLKENSQKRQSCEFYLKHIENFLDSPLEGYETPLNRQKAVVSNLNLLLEETRELLFLNIEKSMQVVEKALKWSQTNSSEITPFHTHLCVLSLKGSKWDVILPHLKQTLFGISESFNAPESFMLFFYYGAIIFGANKKWKEMEQFLFNTFSCPFTSHSHILIDAFKKYLLVGIINNRKDDELPTYMFKTRAQIALFLEKPPRPHRRQNRRQQQHQQEEQTSDVWSKEALEQANRINRMWPYNYFVRECRKNKEREVMQKMTRVFETDGNLGLAQVAVQTIVERRVQKLAGFYVTVPLSKVYSFINLDSDQQAKNVIEQMISEKMLLARLEGDTIHFRDIERKKKLDSLLSRISENSPVIADLKERLDVLKDEKELDPEYVLAKLSYQERDETASKPHNSAAFRDMLAKFNDQKDKF